MALPAEAAVEVGSGGSCLADPQCFNRVHPDMPIIASADPGEIVTFRIRNASDVELGPGRPPSQALSLIHPVTGPVAIRGARRGDVLAVTILDVEPVGYGQTEVAPPAGFASDMGYRREDRWWPGVSVFQRDGDRIVRVSDTEFGPGDDFCSVWHLLGLLPEGPEDWRPKFQY